MRKNSDISRSQAHFESLYRANPDPWNFATSAYERQKYEATLAALGTNRFQSGLEVGCSIGILTKQLATYCDRMIGVDFVPAAITAARARCAAYPNVQIERMQVPQQWPDDRFDLIVFSEVLYFLSQNDLRAACARTIRSILPGGKVLLVNYTEPTDDPNSGEEAASLFIAATVPCLQPVLQRREAHYRLDLLQS